MVDVLMQSVEAQAAYPCVATMILAPSVHDEPADGITKISSLGRFVDSISTLVCVPW